MYEMSKEEHTKNQCKNKLMSSIDCRNMIQQINFRTKTPKVLEDCNQSYIVPLTKEEGNCGLLATGHNAMYTTDKISSKVN